MSPRGTAEILALAIALVPNAAGANDSEPLRAGKARPSRLVPAPSGPPAVLLVWLDVSSAAVGLDGVARSEVRSILEKAGLDIVWRRGSGAEAARLGEIRIILVDRLLIRRDSGRPVLGATPTEVRGHPFVWIHVGSVRAALGLPQSSSTNDLPVLARRNLGVALGRVIAHEIVHALVPSLRHGGALMAESLKREHLTASRLSVDPAVALLVRAAFEPTLTPLSIQAGVPSAEGPSSISAPTLSAARDGRSRREAARDLAR